jgi:hypothetical protein
MHDHRERIGETRHRLVKGHAVLGQIGDGLGCVPFEVKTEPMSSLDHARTLAMRHDTWSTDRS